MSFNKRDCSMLATFAADFVVSGITSIPTLLLKYYKRIKLTDSELALLLQLFRFAQEKKELYPSPEDLSEALNQNPAEIQASLEHLQKRNLLKTVYNHSESWGEVQLSYNFDNLLDSLAEYWALERAAQKNRNQVISSVAPKDLNLARLYGSFQEEFMRSLTPNEMEMVGKWVKQVGIPLVGEALRRAIMAGHKNFRYLDSIILDWQKRGFKSLTEVEEQDRQHREKYEVKRNGKKLVALRGPQTEKPLDKAEEERIKTLRALYIN